MMVLKYSLKDNEAFSCTTHAHVCIHNYNEGNLH